MRRGSHEARRRRKRRKRGGDDTCLVMIRMIHMIQMIHIIQMIHRHDRYFDVGWSDDNTSERNVDDSLTHCLNPTLCVN